MLLDTDVPIRYLRGHTWAEQLLDSLSKPKLPAIAWMEFFPTLARPIPAL
jgi:hypothetical protein